MEVLHFGDLEALRMIREVTRGLTPRELTVVACCMIFCVRRFLAN